MCMFAYVIVIEFVQPYVTLSTSAPLAHLGIHYLSYELHTPE